MLASFSPSSSHPLAALLEGQLGDVVAVETRDLECWVVVDFMYGTVILPAVEFDFYG